MGKSPNTPVVNPTSLIKATTRRLHLQLTPHHFDPSGTAKVRCVARIFPLFWQDGDEKTFSGGGSGSSTSLQTFNKDNNRKTYNLNDVDYPSVSHDSTSFTTGGGHHHGNQNGNLRHAVLYKREALIQSKLLTYCNAINDAFYFVFCLG
jgi:hypothetical protein